jgi:hypothetical protein
MFDKWTVIVSEQWKEMNQVWLSPSDLKETPIVAQFEMFSQFMMELHTTVHNIVPKRIDNLEDSMQSGIAKLMGEVKLGFASLAQNRGYGNHQEQFYETNDQYMDADYPFQPIGSPAEFIDPGDGVSEHSGQGGFVVEEVKRSLVQTTLAPNVLGTKRGRTDSTVKDVFYQYYDEDMFGANTATMTSGITIVTVLKYFGMDG